jgi:enoyl-CoA hydratase/carnithine racemase
MKYRYIIAERDDHTLKITLNRPEVMNAINEELFTELMEALGNADNDPVVRVVVITGKGRAFSAGRDLKGILEGTQYAGGKKYQMLEELKKPVIAAVNGYCFTGAFELVMCADIIIASEDAVFADTHARFGIIPGGGQTQRLPRQIGPMKAKEILFTSDFLSAREAERLGIVNRVVPAAELDTAVTEMARKIAANIPEAVSIIKSLINRGKMTGLASGLRLEDEYHQGPLRPLGEGPERIAALLKGKGKETGN